MERGSESDITATPMFLEGFSTQKPSPLIWRSPWADTIKTLACKNNRIKIKLFDYTEINFKKEDRKKVMLMNKLHRTSIALKRWKKNLTGNTILKLGTSKSLGNVGFGGFWASAKATQTARTTHFILISETVETSTSDLVSLANQLMHDIVTTLLER